MIINPNLKFKYIKNQNCANFNMLLDYSWMPYNGISISGVVRNEPFPDHTVLHVGDPSSRCIRKTLRLSLFSPQAPREVLTFQYSLGTLYHHFASDLGAV